MINSSGYRYMATWLTYKKSYGKIKMYKKQAFISAICSSLYSLKPKGF